MTKHGKYFYVLFVVIIISFIFWGIGGMRSGKNNQVIATVDGTNIPITQFWRAYQRAEDSVRNTYGDKFDDKMKKALKMQVLAGLVGDEMLYHAASSEGITVTNDELRAVIESEPAFSQGGAFSRRVYLNVLRMNRITPQQYESSLRHQLLVDKMRRMIEDPVELSPAELASIPPKLNAQAVTALKGTLLNMKRQRALSSFLDGLRSRMKVTENTGLIS